MLKTTIGQLMINNALPEHMRDYDRVLDKKAIKALLQEVAETDPDKYSDIAKNLSDVGRTAAYSTGGYSVGLRHMRATVAARRTRLELGRAVDKINSDRSLTDTQREHKVLKIVGKYQQTLADEVMDEARSNNNPLARQADTGMRGNKFNVNSLLGADLLYTNHRDEPIALPVLRSYAQGMTPVEYFASSFGARKGVMDLAGKTQEAGFFAKQLSQATHRLLVSARDDDDEYDEASPRGLPVDSDDPDNAGAYLAHPVGGYPRNTELTPKILKDLKSRGHDRILVRSPTVGGPRDGGVYAHDVGVRDRGGISPVGDYVGLSAGQALAEPITQAQICLAAGTLVRMADFSVRAIQDIKAGDWILGADKTGRTFPVRVLRRFDNGERPCYRTVFRQVFLRDAQEDREIISTQEHKLLAIRNCTGQRAEVFNHVPLLYQVGQTGRRFYALASAGYEDAGEALISEPLAPLIGALLGDGCYTKSVHGCYFKCHDPQLVTDLEAFLLPESNIKLTQLQWHRGTYYRVSQCVEVKTPQCAATGKFVGSYRNPIMQWLDSRDMLHKYAHEKRIPDEVYEWDNNSVGLLLGGLFATDGSVFPVEQGRKWGVNFGSTSQRLRDAVRELLELRFGIYGSIAFNPYGARKRPMYYLDINHAVSRLRFLDRIPLLGIKRDTITELEAARPASDCHRHMMFRRLTQEPVGTLPTHDLEVDHTDHLFALANGLIVSNSSKHSGGIAGAGAGAISGFQRINQLVQVPKTFRGGAAHAQLDGRVQHIQDAPQGGTYVTIDGEKHYVGRGFEVRVKPGDDVEAGDMISEGVPNPAEIVRHKGIGEGREYFIRAFRQSLLDANTTGDRRNIELVARGLINHVRLTDEVGDWVPDDVLPYQTLERLWKPRPGHSVIDPRKAVGKYLERPVLHYTVGTKIRKSMLPTLKQFGANTLVVHNDPPPFQPEMVRGMANVSHDPDWMARFMGSYQQKSLLEGARRGDTSNEAGSSFVPALAAGANFGLTGLTKGWNRDAKLTE